MENEKDTELPNNLSAFVCDPISQNTIQAAIKELGMAYASCVIGGIDEAITYLKDHRAPKILLVDLSNSELPLSDMERLLNMSSPEVNILTIGSKNDVGLFRALMRFGIRDYLVKPVSVELIIKALSSIITGVDAYEHVDSRQGKIITFVGVAGGLGTTTLATNCAWILANKQFKRSVIIDSNHQFGNANLLLDLKSESSYLDMLESPDKIDDYFVETMLRRHGPRLFYLGGLDDISKPFETDPDTFAHLIDMVRHQFNYLIVDLQLNINPLNRILISKTKTFVIIADLSTASAYNTARLIEFLKQEARDRNVIIVLNKIGLYTRGALSKDAFEKVTNMQVNHIIPFDAYTPYGAANVGQPLASLDCALNSNLNDIVQSILGNEVNNNKMQEVYDDSVFSKANIKRVLDKFGLSKYVFQDKI